MEWFVQAPLCLQGGDILGCRFAHWQHHRRGVAGDVGEHEHDDAHQQHRDDGLPDAVQDKPLHFRLLNYVPEGSTGFRGRVSPEPRSSGDTRPMGSIGELGLNSADYLATLAYSRCPNTPVRLPNTYSPTSSGFTTRVERMLWIREYPGGAILDGAGRLQWAGAPGVLTRLCSGWLRLRSRETGSQKIRKLPQTPVG